MTEKSPRSPSVLFFLGGFLFIALGAFGGWFAYNEFLKKTAPPTLAVPESRFIVAETSEIIDAFNSITPANPGEIKHFVLDTTVSEFLLTLDARAPGNLVRALEPVFMLGTLGEKRFIIFKLASFENAFAGMLGWEENLAQDLGPIFSTNSLVKNIAPQSVFRDIVSKNKDVRVLYAPIEPSSTTTMPVLLYSFFDNRILIITENLDTLQTLIDRLTREMLSR
jgi:hypothetical protein